MTDLPERLSSISYSFLLQIRLLLESELSGFAA